MSGHQAIVGREMSQTPPEHISILFCPVCGRNDQFTPFTGKRHGFGGKWCPGEPVEVQYSLAAGTDEQ
jgi:hypothetical protein